MITLGGGRMVASPPLFQSNFAVRGLLAVTEHVFPAPLELVLALP